MACYTQEEIAEEVGLSQQAVAKETDNFTTSVLENQSSNSTLAISCCRGELVQ
jgi:DNA-binding XRE family transcriptional regulator